MAAEYHLHLVAADGDPRKEELVVAVTELVGQVGTSEVLEVSVRDGTGYDPAKVPAVLVVLWSDDVDEGSAIASAAEATAQGVVVIPVVASTEHINLPTELRVLNAVGLAQTGTVGLARTCLRELGVHESTRGVFISHRREDGLVAAEQLFTHLTKAGWTPFVDRFGVSAGAVFQERIDDALEETAFLLLLETPNAAGARWVEHEVVYALDHGLGMAIVNIDDAPVFTIASDFPRHKMSADGFTRDAAGHIELTSPGLEEVLELIESQHAVALARRRRQLVVSARSFAESAGLACHLEPGWRLRVVHDDHQEIVGTAPHLPVPADLYGLAHGTSGDDRCVLVHAAHRLDDARRGLLDWVVGDRHIDLVPNNAIGARWAEAGASV